MNPSGSDLETERLLFGRASMLKINRYSNHRKAFQGYGTADYRQNFSAF